MTSTNVEVHNESYEEPLGSLSHLDMPEFNLSDVAEEPTSESQETSVNSVHDLRSNILNSVTPEKPAVNPELEQATLNLHSDKSAPIILPDLGLGVLSLRQKVTELKLSSVQSTEQFVRLNHRVSEAEECARKLVANLQLNSSSSPSPVGPDSYPPNTSLQLIEEKKRREHCEAVIATLQKELLKAQEELGVATASSQYKSTLLQKAHEACNSLLREAETRRLAWEKQLQQLQESENGQANRIQEYETGLSHILDLADQWKLRLAQTEGERVKLKSECTRMSVALESVSKEKSRLETTLVQVRNDFDSERARATILQQELEVVKAHHQRSMEQLKLVQQEQESLKQNFNKARNSFNDAQEQLEQKYIQELANTKRNAELEALERQKAWQREAEAKLKKLVTSCEEHVLHARAKCAEEIQAVRKRYEDSKREMDLTVAELQRNCVQQTADKERLAKQIQRLLEAQWQQVSTMISSNATTPTPVTATLDEGTTSRNHQQILRATYRQIESRTQISTTECSEIESSAWEEDSVSVQAKKVDMLRYVEELRKRKELDNPARQVPKEKAK